MYSIERLRDIRAFEALLGHSHRCDGCGATFLQYEDGCPNCGHSARVSPLRENARRKTEEQKGPGPMEVFCFDDQGLIEGIFECWRWPRPSREELEEMGYVEALNEEGILEIFFIGYICPWPREEKVL